MCVRVCACLCLLPPTRPWSHLPSRSVVCSTARLPRNTPEYLQTQNNHYYYFEGVSRSLLIWPLVVQKEGMLIVNMWLPHIVVYVSDAQMLYFKQGWLLWTTTGGGGCTSVFRKDLGLHFSTYASCLLTFYTKKYLPPSGWCIQVPAKKYTKIDL